jgi:hypothetical protein
MNDIGFKITAEVTHHVVNFLDLTLDLKNQTFSPFRKPNNDPLYVDNRSNHLPSIITISLPLSTNASPRFLPIKHPLTLLHHFTKMRLSAATTMYTYAILGL